MVTRESISVHSVIELTVSLITPSPIYISLSIYLPLSISFTLTLCISLSLSLSLLLSLTSSLSLSFSLTLSHLLSLPLSLTLAIDISLFSIQLCCPGSRGSRNILFLSSIRVVPSSPSGLQACRMRPKRKSRNHIC